MPDFLKISDFDLNEKTVLLRVDINSPVDPISGEFTDTRRLESSAKTIRLLCEKGAKVVVIAHQGRPGEEYDFTKLDQHAKKMSTLLGKEVKHVDDIFGSHAKNEIKNMKKGDVLLLENVRFYAEESIERPGDAQTKTHLVRELAPLFDYYVNDAFAAAHRSQPSLVGFAYKLPALAGPTMEKELSIMNRVLEPNKKKVFLLGGAKVLDSLKVADKALSTGSADSILTGGLVGLVFLAAMGYNLGAPTMEFLRGKGLEKQAAYAKSLLEKNKDRIHVPIDLALNRHGERVEVALWELPMPYLINDIGSGTVGRYKYILSQAEVILANGPMGYFEQPPFDKGTREMLTAMTESNAFTVIGGGHTAVAAEQMGITDKIKHISTGGGACITFLAGEKLPVVSALEYSAQKFREK